ncbi:MAG: AMP-binding protein [Acidobacteriota bacterium]|nr:AMP-binding protein [Acidobacteriota bacterium]
MSTPVLLRGSGCYSRIPAVGEAVDAQDIREAGSLVHILRTRAEVQAGRRAYVFLSHRGANERAVGYAQLDCRARVVAGWLQRRTQPGDRVLLFFPPGLDYVEAFLGCLYAGVIAVPLYPPRARQKLERVARVLENCGARLALTTADLRPKIETFFLQAPHAPEVHATDTVDDAASWEPPQIQPGTLAFLQYTSGSTGVPKGVMVTHGNLVANEKAIGEAFGSNDGDVVVSWLPLYHDMGLIGAVLHPLYRGIPAVLLTSMDFIQDPLCWLEAIHKFKGTLAGGPNFAYELILRRMDPERLKGLDLSGWRVAFNGAEPIRAASLGKFAETFRPLGFTPQTFYPCYGMAEATLFMTGVERDEQPAVQWADKRALERNFAVWTHREDEHLPLVGCGRPRPDHQLLIVDPETGEALDQNHIGEIWFAGPSVAGGYWNRPDATEYAFNAHTADGEGPFLRTGDLGFLNEGQLYVTGRLKDLVIVRGRNYYPTDIEKVAEAAHPALRPGCGAAFSLEEGGEERLVIAQEVERQHVRNLNADEVTAAVRAAVADAFELQLHGLLLLKPGGVPKTSSGKIRRFGAREGYLQGALAVIAQDIAEVAEDIEIPDLDRATLSTAEDRAELFSRWFRGQICNTLRTRTIDPNLPLPAMGLDSIAAIELLHRLEKDLGIRIPVVKLLDSPHLAALEAACLDAFDQTVETTGEKQTIPDRFPLAPNQEGLYFLQRFAPENAAYNLHFATRIEGLKEPDQLRLAFEKVLKRHPAVTVRFGEEDGTPYQEFSSVHAPLGAHASSVHANRESPRGRGEADRGQGEIKLNRQQMTTPRKSTQDACAPRGSTSPRPEGDSRLAGTQDACAPRVFASPGGRCLACMRSEFSLKPAKAGDRCVPSWCGADWKYC